MTLSEDLLWRGLIKDKTFLDNAWLDRPQTFYHGVDGSSDSLTVGNLAALILAKRIALAGWKPVLLVGGATSLVGDPGGKKVERDLKSIEEVEANVAAIKKQIEKLFTGQETIFVNNIDWFSGIKFLDFLRDVGKHYSMTELTQRDYITERMGEGGGGISYGEFSYTLIQGYDFWHLYKQYRVVLQIGGSDQWGNMLSGVPLIKKKENIDVHVMTMPLVVNNATGVKFGKTESGAVWLDEAKTSPTEFYQFWMNISDEDAIAYLKIFTFLSKDEIEDIEKKHNIEASKRLAQTRLAQEVTDLVHGEDLRRQAQVATKYLTSQVLVANASVEDIAELKKGIPSVLSAENDSIIDVLVKTKLAASNSDARRLLQSGAIYINGQGVGRDKFEGKDFTGGRLILRRGKAFKDSALVELKV